MIAIIDNGVGYSDHAIWFLEVESGDEANAFLLALRALKPYWGDDAKILATAQSVTWWHGGALTIDAWLESKAWEFVGPNPDKLPLYDALPLAWIERIARAMREAWAQGEETWHAYVARRRAA